MQEWKAFSEKDLVWPFQKADESLDKTAIRFSPSGQFDEAPHHQFPENPLINVNNFKPELKIAVDQKSLFDQTGLSLNETKLSIAIRDRAIRRFLCVYSSICQDANGQNVKLDESFLQQLSGRRNLDIVAIITPTKKIGAYSPGDRIAEKVFECSVPGETHGGFPIAIVDPEDPHWDKAYSENTTWYISWKPAAIFNNSAEAEHVLSLVYNKQCADKILHFENDTNRASGLFNLEMSVEVFHEIACVYLFPPDDSTEPPDFSQRGFYPKIVAAICRIMDVDVSLNGYTDLKQQFKTNVGFMSLLRSKLQEFYGLKDKINRVKAP